MTPHTAPCTLRALRYLGYQWYKISEHDRIESWVIGSMGELDHACVYWNGDGHDVRMTVRATMGLGNVWRAPTVAGPERLRAPDGSTLHPCQKPLAFAERMIRASTRPGDTVWVPFGGTLRELVAAEHIAQREPNEARKVLTCELNQDGVDYLTPAIEQATGRPLLQVKHAQQRLFG